MIALYAVSNAQSQLQDIVTLACHDCSRPLVHRECLISDDTSVRAGAIDCGEHTLSKDFIGFRDGLHAAHGINWVQLWTETCTLALGTVRSQPLCWARAKGTVEQRLSRVRLAWGVLDHIASSGKHLESLSSPVLDVVRRVVVQVWVALLHLIAVRLLDLLRQTCEVSAVAPLPSEPPDNLRRQLS